MDKTDSLRKRGQFSSEDIDEFKGCTRCELMQLLNNEAAVVRSAAVHILGTRYDVDEEMASVLLDQLASERALYTRLEICNILETGNIQTARSMTEYLGRIGNNQYKDLPDRGSHKVSYPLPRDIIARSLGRMRPEIYPALTDVLKSHDVAKVSEACDAAGFLVFYNQVLATDDNAHFICSLVDKYSTNELILWKTITCLSAFNQKFILDRLEQIKAQDHPEVIYMEVERSLSIIHRRDKGK